MLLQQSPSLASSASSASRSRRGAVLRSRVPPAFTSTIRPSLAQQRGSSAVAHALKTKSSPAKQQAEELDMTLDTGALAKYAGAVPLQVGIMTGALFLLDQATHALAAAESLPGGVEGEAAAKWLFTAFFLVTSIKSRVFSPLDASRPSLKGEKKAMDDRKRPSWMPPPLVFPIVWSTIGLLRCASSVMVWEACGRDALALPLIVMCTHLAIGDCWNHINNVEKRLGVAVPGVLCCFASALAVVAAYYNTDSSAGLLLSPSAVWIGIASVLIISIWDLNGRAPLYPVKGESLPAQS